MSDILLWRLGGSGFAQQTDGYRHGLDGCECPFSLAVGWQRPYGVILRDVDSRLKGRGMRWDKDNAESIMALASLYYSNLWTDY